MKARLAFRDRDFDLKLLDPDTVAAAMGPMEIRGALLDRDMHLLARLPSGTGALIQDLELNRVLNVMAAGDRYLFEVARAALFAGLDDPDAIRYRQAVLTDCLRQPDVMRSIYLIAVDAIEQARKVWGGFGPRYPDGLLGHAVRVLEVLVVQLRRLRDVAGSVRPGVESDGFTRLFDMIVVELDDEYLATVDEHLRRLQFRSGVPMSARLGESNESAGHALRRPVRKRSLLDRIGLGERGSYVYEIDPRDQAGSAALKELRSRGVAIAAVVAEQSWKHILDFFALLRAELGFYVACLNLADALAQKGEPTCMPEPHPVGNPVLACTGLYDAALSLSVEGRVIGNDVNADGRSLIVITGANRGGKSTFLRSLGIAHLMMQSGMFVPAESFAADIRPRLLSHFKREEDAALERGKLDEELARMSLLVDHLVNSSLVLFNESFASTNEREGSEIGRQAIHALVEGGHRVVFVTHMFDLADSLRAEQAPNATFLRAERRADGERTFRLVPGDPEPTSHGDDIFRRVFGARFEPPRVDRGATVG